MATTEDVPNIDESAKHCFFGNELATLSLGIFSHGNSIRQIDVATADIQCCVLDSKAGSIAGYLFPSLALERRMVSSLCISAAYSMDDETTRLFLQEQDNYFLRWMREQEEPLNDDLQSLDNAQAEKYMRNRAIDWFNEVQTMCKAQFMGRRVISSTALALIWRTEEAVMATIANLGSTRLFRVAVSENDKLLVTELTPSQYTQVGGVSMNAIGSDHLGLKLPTITTKELRQFGPEGFKQSGLLAVTQSVTELRDPTNPHPVQPSSKGNKRRAELLRANFDRTPPYLDGGKLLVPAMLEGFKKVDFKKPSKGLRAGSLGFCSALVPNQSGQ